MDVVGALVGEERLQGAFEVIERAFTAKTNAQLDEIMAAAFAAYGITWLSVDQMRDTSRTIVGHHHFGGWPADWAHHYLQEKHYLHDAVVRHAITSPTPMHWIKAQKGGALSEAERRLFEEAGEFGLKDGLVTPLHQVDGAISCVVITAPEPLKLSIIDYASLRLLSIYYCSFGLALKHAPSEPRTPLTARQRECLQWVRAGKSSWEIGEIVGISERTVNFHIEEACRRLNVSTRQQAVIEAVINGMIAL